MKMTRQPKPLPEEVVKQLIEIGERAKSVKLNSTADPKVKAEVSKLNRMSLSRICRGKDFHMSSLLQYINALGMTTEEFFQGLK